MRQNLTEEKKTAEDVLDTAACFLEQLAVTLRHARENYIDEDGSFQDIKIGEIDKWLPIVRYAAQRTQAISEQCFEKDLTVDTDNEILRFLLTWLGLKSS